MLYDKKKNILYPTFLNWKKVYNQSFPWLVTLAEESENAKYFKDALRSLILSRLTEKESTQENVGMAVAMRILLLIEHDDTSWTSCLRASVFRCGRSLIFGSSWPAIWKMRSLLIYLSTYTISWFIGTSGWILPDPGIGEKADEPLADRTRPGGDRYPWEEQGAYHRLLDQEDRKTP